jgi:hypothetical protein
MWACDDSSAYPFSARELDPRGCLGAVVSLDVLSGNADPGLGCTPRCFVSKADEAGATTVYGTTMCGPAPPGFDGTETDPRCKVAKEAVSRGDLCLADGGETAPPDASDGATVDSAIVDSAIVDSAIVDAADASKVDASTADATTD